MTAGKGVDAELATTKRLPNTRLWLCLLEDMSKAEWPPTLEGQGWRVLLNASDTLHGCGHTGLYRASPVFPVTPDFSAPDLSSGAYYLCFYSFDPAFPVLGRLSRKGSKEI